MTNTTGNLGGNDTSGYYDNISISDAGQTAGGTVVVAYDSYANDLDPNAADTNNTQDVYAFPFGQKGLMAGLGLEGSKITPINPS